MIRRAAIAGALALLAACGPPDPGDDPAGRADTRQQPSTLTPGVHIGGHVNVGVLRTF